MGKKFLELRSGPAARGKWSRAERRAAGPDGSKPGGRDERGFWRLERTRREGGGDAFSPWREPKPALVAAGKILGIISLPLHKANLPIKIPTANVSTMNRKLEIASL